MTSTWVASSVSRSVSASYMSRWSWGLIALRFSGRLSRMVVIPSCVSTRMVEYSATVPSLGAAGAVRLGLRGPARRPPRLPPHYAGRAGAVHAGEPVVGGAVPYRHARGVARRVAAAGPRPGRRAVGPAEPAHHPRHRGAAAVA